MKKTLYFILFFFLQYVVTQAQTFTVPDVNFFNAILTAQPSCSTCVTNYVTREFDAACIDGLNITGLSVTNQNITNLLGVEYFVDLQYLSCQQNQLTSLPNLPSLLINLTCEQNQLTSLPILPSNLVVLTCYQNQLVTLPSLPNSIVNLTCNQNQLTALPTLPSSLTFLGCDYNQLTSLPALPSLLEDLWCGNNQLTSLPALPNTLSDLVCDNNQLTSLPTLSNSLLNLYCNNNQLTSLPTLPNSLMNLLCSSNLISNIPILPNSLLELSCDNNNLTNLPTLPNSLTQLYCGENLLSDLPDLPNSITMLSCSSNQLTSLPKLPNSLLDLACSDNLLTYLPKLPLSLGSLDCQNNPISCLPILPSSLTDLYIGFTPISCLPNKPAGIVAAYASMPICTPQNSICFGLYSNETPETYPPSAPRQAQTQIMNLPHTQVNTDTVTFAKVNINGTDMAILGSDVVLGEMSSLPLWYNTAINNDPLFLWEGKIPYDTLVEVGNIQVGISQIDSISKAIRYYNTQAALRGVKIPFVPRVPSDIHWVKFKHYENGFASRIGCINDTGNEQAIWVDTAGYSGKILHELTHTVGLYHEHQRQNRNTYVSLSPQNVHQEYLDNYSLIRDVEQTPYDYASLMHYWCYGFSVMPPVDGVNIPPDNLMLVMQPTFSMEDKQMGQRAFYTDEDIVDINQLYPDGIIGGIGVNGTGVFTLQLPTIPSNMINTISWSYTCTENCVANNIALSNVVGNPNRIQVTYSNNVVGFYHNSRGFLEATVTLLNGQIKKFYRYVFRN